MEEYYKDHHIVVTAEQLRDTKQWTPKPAIISIVESRHIVESQGITKSFSTQGEGRKSSNRIRKKVDRRESRVNHSSALSLHEQNG
jgi:hypothetical protein